MKNVNKVIILGNMARDPEIKTTQGGQKIATFTLATNRQWTAKSGEKNSLAEFHNVVAWGKLAEICADFLYKGRPAYVEGYLKTRSWETDSGAKAYRTEIVAQNVVMLGASKQGLQDDEEKAVSEIGASDDDFSFDDADSDDLEAKDS